MRPSFCEILIELNSILDIQFDLEIIAQTNRFDLLEEGLKTSSIKSTTMDSLGRSLLHQCAIFGNLQMMKHLTEIWGNDILNLVDSQGFSVTHFAARNGNLEMLQYLASKSSLSCMCESKFRLNALDITFIMKHFDCFHYLIPYLSHGTGLSFSLLSASYEGDLETVKLLIERGGADINSQAIDNGASRFKINI